MTHRYQPPFEHQPTQPDRADDLVRLYQQACTLSEQAGAQPNPAVRAAVLAAAAQNVAAIGHEAKQAMPPPTFGADVEKAQASALSVGAAASDAARGDRTATAALNASSTVGVVAKLPANKRAEAVNDARWKVRAMRAFGSLAAVGLVGLLASRFLPHTEGYAELAQTLPPAPYQQQAATQPAAMPAQPEVAAHTDATAADAPTSSPMPSTEQAAAAKAEKAKDAPAAAVTTSPTKEAADTPLPVARPAATPAPKAAAKDKPLLKQARPKAQQQTQQNKLARQPLAVPSQSSAMQAQQLSTQSHQAEHAEATAAPLAVRGAPSRSAAKDGDSRFDQAANRQASRSAKEQQAALPFPLDDAPVAAKGRLKSAAPHTSAEPAAAVQSRVQGREPWVDSVQLAPPAASDLPNERLLARRSLSALGQAQELAPEIEQGAMPSVAPHIAAPHVSAQSKRRPLALPAAPAEAGQQTAALFASASRGDVEGVQQALQAGAAINVRDAAGRTALMRAAANGHLHVVRALLRHGADTALTDAAGRDAADYARLGGHERVAQLLSGKP